MSKKPTIVIDLDGTLTEDTWPKLGEWMPGAVEAMHHLTDVARLVIHTCRISPVSIQGQPRHPADIQGSINEIREKLDRAYLMQVEIHTDKGKPSGLAYIDNKGIRYAGRPNSWKALTPRLVAMCGDFEKAAAIDGAEQVHL